MGASDWPRRIRQDPYSIGVATPSFRDRNLSIKVSGRGISRVHEDACGTDGHAVDNMAANGFGEVLVGQVDAKCRKHAGFFLSELLD